MRLSLQHEKLSVSASVFCRRIFNAIKEYKLGAFSQYDVPLLVQQRKSRDTDWGIKCIKRPLIRGMTLDFAHTTLHGHHQSAVVLNLAHKERRVLPLVGGHLSFACNHFGFVRPPH
jgi:hypothetical protein